MLDRLIEATSKYGADFGELELGAKNGVHLRKTNKVFRKDVQPLLMAKFSRIMTSRTTAYKFSPKNYGKRLFRKMSQKIHILTEH